MQRQQKKTHTYDLKILQGEELSGLKSLQKDLEDALRRARSDSDHFKKQLTEAHRVAMSQASVAASVHAATAGNAAAASYGPQPGDVVSSVSPSPSDTTSTPVSNSAAGTLAGLYGVKANSPAAYSVTPIDGNIKA